MTPVAPGSKTCVCAAFRALIMRASHVPQGPVVMEHSFLYETRNPDQCCFQVAIFAYFSLLKILYK